MFVILSEGTDSRYRRVFGEETSQPKDMCEARTNRYSLHWRRVSPTSQDGAGASALSALKAYPGNIISEELERSLAAASCATHLLLSDQKARHEVGVDAKTGTVLENCVEGKTSD